MIKDVTLVLQSSLLHPAAHCSETGIDFAWRRAKDQRDQSITSNLDILEGTHDMDFPGANL